MMCELTHPLLGSSKVPDAYLSATCRLLESMRKTELDLSSCHVVVIDLPLLRVAVEGSDNPISLEKPCQASLPPDQQGRHSLGRHPEVQYVA